MLDIGCGMGDVTNCRSTCWIAGKSSIDLDQASIETAQRRAAGFGFENTSFNRADVAAYVPPNSFDAIIGRLVLQFVPDPIAIIKHLYGMLRPGGILALQEPTWKLWLTCTAHLPLRLAVTKAARDAFQAGGARTEMEQQLYQGFIASGLHATQLRVEVPLGNSPEFRGRADLLQLCPNIISKGCYIGHLGDLNAEGSTRSGAGQPKLVAASLIGAFGRVNPHVIVQRTRCWWSRLPVMADSGPPGTSAFTAARGPKRTSLGDARGRDLAVRFSRRPDWQACRHPGDRHPAAHSAATHCFS